MVLSLRMDSLRMMVRTSGVLLEIDESLTEKMLVGGAGTKVGLKYVTRHKSL